MVSRRLWIPRDELNADRTAQAQKMLGDAFKGVRDAAGDAASQVGDALKEDRIGWAQRQMEQAFAPLRQAPQPEPMEPPPAPPQATSPAAPTLGMVNTAPVPGVDIPDDSPASPTTSVEPLPMGKPPGPGGPGGPSGVTPLGPASTTPTDGAMDRLGQAKNLLADSFKGIRESVGNLGEARDTALQRPTTDLTSGVGDAFSGLGTAVHDIGFRAPGQDGKGILGNTGLGEQVRAASDWSKNLGETYTPKALSEDEGLFGKNGALQNAIKPMDTGTPMGDLMYGVERTGLPSQARGAIRTGGDWLKSLDTLGTGLDKLTGRDSSLQDRGQGALETGMGVIGAVAPQFNYIGNVAAESAKQQGMDEDKAEIVGAVVGFLTPGGGTEQLGKAGSYLSRTRGAESALGRLGGRAEDFARVTGNLAETPEELAKFGRFKSLAPAAGMAAAAPIGGYLGGREAAEKEGATPGDIAAGAVGGAFRAADLTGGIGEMGIGTAQGLVKGARSLPGRIGAVRSALGDGQEAVNNFIAYHGTADTYKKPRPGGGIFGQAHYLSSDPRTSEIYAADRANSSFHQAVQDKLMAERELAALPGRTDISPEDRQANQDWLTEQIESADAMIARGHAGDPRVIGPSAGSPQIRPTDIPDDMKLLDLNQPLERDEAIQLLALLSGGRGRRTGDVHPDAIARIERMVASGAPKSALYEAIVDPPRANFSAQKVHDTANTVNGALRRMGYDGIKYVGERSSALPNDTGGFDPYTEYAIFPDSMKKIRNALTGKPFGITPDGVPTSVDGKPQITRGLKMDAAGEVLGGIAGAQVASQGGLADEMIDDENDPNARLKRAGLGALGFAVGSQAGGKLRRNAGTFRRVAEAFRTGEAPGARERVIPPAVARSLPGVNPQPNDFEFGRKSGFMPNRMDVAHSIRNTPNARLFPDGTLQLDLYRMGKEHRELGETGRGGVFYYPTEQQVNMYATGAQAGEGGNVMYKGPTAFRNPLFVDETGSMGRDIGSAFLGKAKYEETERYLDALLKGMDESTLQRATAKFQELGWEPDEARQIAASLRQQRSRHGTSYALPESIGAGLLRSNGYEAAIGIQRADQGRNVKIGEIFDVREAAYPGKGPDDYRVLPQFTRDTPRALDAGRPTTPQLKQIARAEQEGRIPKGMDSKAALRDNAVLESLGLDERSYEMLPQQAKLALDRHLFDDDADRSTPTKDLVQQLLKTRGAPTSRWSSDAAYEGQTGGSGMSASDYKKTLKAPTGNEQYLSDIANDTFSTYGVVYNPSLGKYITINPNTGGQEFSNSYFSAELKLLKHHPDLKVEEVPKVSDLQEKAAALGTPSTSVGEPDLPELNPDFKFDLDEDLEPPILNVQSYEDYKSQHAKMALGDIAYDPNDDMYWVKGGDSVDDTLTSYDKQGALVAASKVLKEQQFTQEDYNGYFDNASGEWKEDYLPPLLSNLEVSQPDVWNSLNLGAIWEDSKTGDFNVKSGPGDGEYETFPGLAVAKEWAAEKGFDTSNPYGPAPEGTGQAPGEPTMHYAANTPDMEAAWPQYKIGDVVYNNDTDGYHVKTADTYQDSPYHIDKADALYDAKFQKINQAEQAAYTPGPEDEEAALLAAAQKLFGDYADKGESIQAANEKLKKGIYTDESAEAITDNWQAYKVGDVIYNEKSGNYNVKTGEATDAKKWYADETQALAEAEHYKPSIYGTDAEGNKTVLGHTIKTPEQADAEAKAGLEMWGKPKAPEAPEAPAGPDWSKPVEIESKDFNDLDDTAPEGAVVYLTDAGYYGVKQQHTPVGGDWVQFQSEKAAMDDAAKVQAQTQKNNPSLWEKIKAGFKALGSDEAGVLGVRAGANDDPAAVQARIDARNARRRELRAERSAAANAERVAAAQEQGATNPQARATGPDSPGNLPKIRQRAGVPVGGPHTEQWDEATMGTRPTSEFEDESVEIPSLRDLAARETPITMADAQAIMKRQAAEVRREKVALDELRAAAPDNKALAFLTKQWQGRSKGLGTRQQAVRELAEANARAAGPTAEAQGTNVKREENRTGRRKANIEARAEEDRAVVMGEGGEGEGEVGPGDATDVDGIERVETEAGPRAVNEQGQVVASRSPDEVDLDGKPVGQTGPSPAQRKQDAMPLTPEGGVAPGGVVEPGGTVEEGGRVGAGATVGKGADVQEGATVQPGAIVRRGATAGPRTLRTGAPTTASTVTTIPATPGVPAVTVSTGRTRTTTGTPKTPKTPKAPPPPKTPKSPPTPTPPPPQVAETGWFNEKGKLKPIAQLEASVRKELQDDYNRWTSFKKQYDSAKGDAEKAKVQASYEAAVGKLNAKKAAAISGMSEQDILTLASKEVSARALMARAKASGMVGDINEYAAQDFLTNYARANLIGANPLTMARNAFGGATSLIWHPIESLLASAADPVVRWQYARKGLDTRFDRRYGAETGYLINGYWRALPAAIINMGAAMKQGQAYTARGLEEQLGNQVRGGNKATNLMRQTTDQVLKPLTATDAFFRTLTQGGEVMRQSYRQMKDAGKTKAEIDADLIKLLKGPRADYVKALGELNTKELAKGVQKQMDYRAFGQGLTEEDWAGRGLQQIQQKMPLGNLILPFVTTPYNAAKFDLERSPIGAAKALIDLARAPGEQVKVTGSVGRRMNASLKDATISPGEMSDRLARGMAGSALFAGLAGATLSGALDINGALPDSQDERDEWEAQGRKPYTILIDLPGVAPRYVSFQDVPGLNATLTQAAILKDVLNKYGDQDKSAPEAVIRGILEATRSLAAQPMASGALEFAQNIGRPGGDVSGFMGSTITPLLLGSGIARTLTTAADPMQREQPKTPGEILSAPYLRGNLPVRHTAYGDEMGNQNAGLAGINPLRTSSVAQFEAPTRYVTSERASTDVAIGRSKARVDAYKRDPVNQPAPSMDDWINARLATVAKDPYTELVRGQETTRASGELAQRKSRTLDDWLAEPVRR